MKNVLLWIFIYIPIASTIIFYVLPLLFGLLALLFAWVEDLFTKNKKKSRYSVNIERTNIKKQNKNQPVFVFIGIGILCLLLVGIIISQNRPVQRVSVKHNNYAQEQIHRNTIIKNNVNNNKVDNFINQQQKENVLYKNSRIHFDISEITSEAKLKQSVKYIYDTCVKANMAQPDTDDIDSQLFCECFVANFLYNLNSYGAQYILDYISSLSQNEVNAIKKANKGKKTFMLPNLMNRYKQHLISDNVLDLQRDIAAFTCFRELSDDTDLLPKWLDTDKMAENLEKLNPYDKKFNQATNEELLNNEEYEQMMQRNMVFSYNSCLKNMPFKQLKGFPEDFPKQMCYCITKNYFYFWPGILMYDISSNINELKKISNTEIAQASHKISNFNDFDVLYKSNKDYSSEPFLKKIDMVYRTAIGGCSKWVVQDFLFDTEAIIDEVFDTDDK